MFAAARINLFPFIQTIKRVWHIIMHNSVACSN